MKIDLSNVPPEHRAEAERIAAEISASATANPLGVFQPHCAEQRKFLEARTATVAAFCGNQSGKSTIGGVRALIELLPPKLVPEHLRGYQRWAGPTHGWALCPTEAKVFDSLLPAIAKWCPPSALKGGTISKAFNGDKMMLSFVDGSTIHFKTYKQAPDTLGGATLHFVWYDEPPPRAHRDECATRLLRYNGFELYTMTPLKSNTGWIRRDIWRKREDPDITVCKWSMRDNPALSKDAIPRILASYKNDIWRQAREFGDFMDQAGQVYGQFESRVQRETPRPSRELMASLDHVWGIDPGIRNAAIICGGFDSHGVDWIYDEILIQNGTPSQYAQAIDILCAKWRLHRARIMFVIDPAARQRSQATGDTVQSELSRVGIHTVNGANDREAGQQQIRDRLLHNRLRIFPNCVGLRDDADEFSWDMDDEDEDVSGAADDSPFHRLATLRYQVMTRPFYAQREIDATTKGLGSRAVNQAVDLRFLQPKVEVGPMGSMS